MKKIFKRVLSIGLFMLLSIVLIACGEGGSDADSGEGVLAGKTVGFSQTDSMSAWRTTETDSITEYIEDEGGEIVVQDAEGDIATQESNIRDLIASGVDYLIAAPIESDGLQSAFEEAMNADVPVILVDRALDGEAGVHYTTEITSDFIWQGEQAGEVLTEALPDGGNVVIINGGYDSPTSTERQEGFTETLDSEKFEVVSEQNGNWLMADAQSVMENILQAEGGENIDAVYAITDDMIQGAKTAIENDGLVPGEDILTIGVDGSQAALEDVESGEQLASITSSPYFGPIVLETITALEKGEEIPEDITFDDTVYTQENVDVEAGF